MATSFEVSHSSSGHATEKRNKQNLLGPCQNTCFESDGLHSKQWLYIKERENKARNIYRLAVLAATLMVHLFVFLTKGLFTTENSTHKQLTNIRGIHTTLSTIQLLRQVIITLKTFTTFGIYTTVFLRQTISMSEFTIHTPHQHA